MSEDGGPVEHRESERCSFCKNVDEDSQAISIDCCCAWEKKEWEEKENLDC